MEGWKWKLDGLLPPHICSKLVTMFLRQDEERPDNICMKETNYGSFIVKTAYILVAHSPVAPNGIWKWIWKL